MKDKIVRYEYQSYNPNEEVYDPVDVHKKTGIKLATVYTRFRSRYAKERWGVEVRELPDGTFKKFVIGDSINKWKEDIRYRGRPVKISV